MKVKVDFLLVLFILIICVLGAFLLVKERKKSTLENMDPQQRPPRRVWLFWEHRSGQKTPTYIKLCHESVKKNCKDLDVTILTNTNIGRYLPDLRDLSKLSLPHKADYIRLAILQKYGGMWIDSDIIVYRSLRNLINKLQTQDFVGFGCNGMILKSDGYPRPSNWAMISRKNGILIGRCLEKANKILDSDLDLSKQKNYHKIGRELLWSEISYLLRNTSWNYLHWSSIGVEQDRNGEKFTNERLVSNDIENPVKNAYFSVMYNTAPGFDDNFLSLSKEELLKSNMLVSRMYRKAFNMKKY